jgi:ubiquinone/menaquinone biosynthesis C-methylase UbiE
MTYNTEKQIVDYYYKYVYSKIWGKNFFMAYAERFMERISPAEQENTLEIGGGKGEHLNFVKKFPANQYILLDSRNIDKNDLLKINDNYEKVCFVKGQVQEIPFPDEYFDHIKSTCVLHHVERLLDSILELRRVATNNCKIIILIPTDPGLFNRVIKRLYTYPKINRVSKFPASLIYSLDHKNSYNNILNVIKFVFSKDQIKITFLPFLFKSVNFNLISIVQITVRK